MDKNLTLKDYLAKMYYLAKNKYYDKELYKYILALIEPQIIVRTQSRTRELEKSLNNYMENLSNQIDKVDENDNKSLFPFWVSYMYWAMWQTLRTDGIGHLKEFYLDGKLIHCSIYVDMQIRKEYTETKDEFENRKERFKNFLKENNLNKVKTSTGDRLEDNQHNKDFLIQHINKYSSPVRVDFGIKNNTIDTMDLYFNTTSTFNFKKTKPKPKPTNNQGYSLSLTDLELEKIANNIKEWLNALSCIDEYETTQSISGQELSNTCLDLCFTLYNNTCEIVNLENEKTKIYKKQCLVNKEKNSLIENKRETFGETYNYKQALEIHSVMRDVLSEYLKKEYCLNLFSLHTQENSIVEITFNSYEYSMTKYYEKNSDEKEDTINIEKINKIFLFDDDMDIDNPYLPFNLKNMNVIKDLITSFNGEIIETNIVYKNGKENIGKIIFRIKDIEMLIRFCYENKDKYIK